MSEKLGQFLPTPKKLSLLSVVLPVFNEEANIESIYKAILNVIEDKDFAYELIFIDDGSFDRSFEVLSQIATTNTNVKLVQLTRNFGHQTALTAGLELAKGDAIITMDADFQDPPEKIIEFIEKWQNGALVVFGQRKSRKEGVFKKLSASLYYELLYRFSDIKIKGNIADFRLIDSAVANQLRGIREKTKYLRGLVSWMGYPYDIVVYERPERQHGKTKFSLLRMIRLAMDGILNFSLVPIRLGLFLGIFTVLIGFLFLTYIIADTLIYGTYYPLYKWISVTTFTFVGFLFILIWILAEYIGSVREQLLTRPTYVIKESKNLE